MPVARRSGGNLAVDLLNFTPKTGTNGHPARESPRPLVKCVRSGPTIPADPAKCKKMPRNSEFRGLTMLCANLNGLDAQAVRDRAFIRPSFNPEAESDRRVVTTEISQFVNI